MDTNHIDPTRRQQERSVLRPPRAPRRSVLAIQPGAQPNVSRLLRARSLTIGLALLAVIGGAATAADLLAPGDPGRATGPALQAPSPAYWLGTDDLGRNVFTRVVRGSQVSLLVGGLVALVSAAIGTLVGAVSGYFGSWVDDLLMRTTELVQIVPRFFLAIVIAALFGPSVWLIAVLLGLTSWPHTARLLRAQVLSLREREFVLAARAIGLGDLGILWRHVLPNSLSVVLVSSALQVGSAILIEAGLSFLGLSDPTVVSWGAMLNGAQPFIRRAWWMSVFPGLAILLTVLAANLIADGLQDLFDPRRSGGRKGA